MSYTDSYAFERGTILGNYETAVLFVNGYFAMQFTVKLNADGNGGYAIVGYYVNNPYSCEYYRSHGIEPVNSSGCIANMSANCYIPVSEAVYDNLEALLIRVYREFCNGFAVSRFGMHLDIEMFFDNL